MAIGPGERCGWITLIETKTSLLIDGCLCRDPVAAVGYVHQGAGLRLYLRLAYEESLQRELKINEYAISAEAVGRGESGEVMVHVQVHGFHSTVT